MFGATNCLTVPLFPVDKVYDGYVLEYFEKDYFAKWVTGLPEGYSLTLSIGGSMVEAGILSYEEIEILEFAVYDERGNDVTYDFYVVFDGTPLTIYPCEIEITSASQSKKYDGQPLTNSSVEITRGMLAEGHRLIATASGSITDEGTTENVIKEVVILDAMGNDVTHNYDIKMNFGTLTVEPD